MKIIFETKGGEYVSFSWLAWEFIKSTNQIKEFRLFKSALIKEEIEMFD